MSLKEDYPSPDGSCNDHHEPSYYEPTMTDGYQQHHHQLLQWQCPSDEQPQHVLVYDSLDGDQARPTHENCLLPAILGKCLRRTTASVYNVLNSLWASQRGSFRRGWGNWASNALQTVPIPTKQLILFWHLFILIRKWVCVCVFLFLTRSAGTESISTF